jgi:hypothetical protein
VLKAIIWSENQHSQTEKVEYNTCNWTRNQRRSWKAKESAKEGNLGLAGNNPIKKNPPSDSLRRRGLSDRAIYKGKFCGEKPKVQGEKGVLRPCPLQFLVETKKISVKENRMQIMSCKLNLLMKPTILSSQRQQV